MFRPTMEQFKDFMSFMESIDSYGRRSGIVKVIPPEEWYVRGGSGIQKIMKSGFCRQQSLPSVRSALEHVRVRNPIVSYKSKGGGPREMIDSGISQFWLVLFGSM